MITRSLRYTSEVSVIFYYYLLKAACGIYSISLCYIYSISLCYINRLLNVLYWLIFLYLFWTIDLLTLLTCSRSRSFLVSTGSFLLFVPLLLVEHLHVAINKLKNSDHLDLDEVKLCWRVLIQLTTSLFQTQITF